MRPLFLLALAVPLFAACGNTGGADRPAGSTGSSPPASSGGPGSTPTDRPLPTRTGCGRDPVTVTARPGDRPDPVCLTQGGTLRVITEASPRQPWTPPISSDESVLRCTSQALANGAAEATCTAVNAGIATVTTSTGPFAGDPHGPPQESWQLRVTVTAS
jgi:hypothetical protein